MRAREYSRPMKCLKYEMRKKVKDYKVGGETRKEG